LPPLQRQAAQRQAACSAAQRQGGLGSAGGMTRTVAGAAWVLLPCLQVKFISDKKTDKLLGAWIVGPNAGAAAAAAAGLPPAPHEHSWARRQPHMGGVRAFERTGRAVHRGGVGHAGCQRWQ
jgi:hypothetical protein